MKTASIDALASNEHLKCVNVSLNIQTYKYIYVHIQNVCYIQVLTQYTYKLIDAHSKYLLHKDTYVIPIQVYTYAFIVANIDT